MGRPIKQTADYFPHMAVPGKTLFILQNQFGNDGYAFWFKLLELLCVSDGHSYDCSKPADFEFLTAKTGVSSEKTQQIMQLLYELEAIDQGLWKQHRIIWVQNLVNNLSPVYRQRRTPLPPKPVSSVINAVSSDDNTGSCGVSNIDNCQSSRESRLDKSKVNKSREDDDPLPPTTPAENLSSSSSENQEDDLPEDENIFTLYEQEVGELTPGISELLKDAEMEYPAEWIAGAIKLAATQNKRNWSYIKGILDNCKAENHAPGDGKGKAPPGRNDDPDKYVKGRYGHVVKRS